MDRARLKTLLDELERDGVLDRAQREAVFLRLANDAWLAPRVDSTPASQEPPELKKDGLGRFVSIIGMFGGFLLALGVFSLFASNWDHMSKETKLVLIFGTLIGVHFLGYRLAESPGNAPKIGRGLTAAGVLIFGGAIALVGQIYHLTAHYPNWMLVWWATSLPLAMITRSRTILSIVILLFGAWVFWQAGVFLDDQGNSFDHDFVAAFASLALGIAIFFKGIIAILNKSSWDDFAQVLRLYSAPAAIGAIYVLSFKDAVDHSSGTTGFIVFAPALLIAALGTALLLLAVKRRDGRSDAVDGLGLVGAFAILVLLLHAHTVLIVLVANVLLFVGLIGMIGRGVQHGVPAYVNYGTLGFLVVLMTRYFEYLAELLGPFFSFCGAGALLLGVGYVLERKRRTLVQQAQNSIARLK